MYVVELLPKDCKPLAKQEASFAHKLISLREAAGLSQYQLAQKTGLTRQALSLLEFGEREPSWATVQAIAMGLGVNCTAFEHAGAAATPARARRSKEVKRTRKK